MNYDSSGVESREQLSVPLQCTIMPLAASWSCSSPAGGSWRGRRGGRAWCRAATPAPRTPRPHAPPPASLHTGQLLHGAVVSITCLGRVASSGRGGGIPARSATWWRARGAPSPSPTARAPPPPVWGRGGGVAAAGRGSARPARSRGAPS